MSSRGERFFRLQLDGYGDALETCVTAILDRLARTLRAEERLAAIWPAEVRVRGGRLECLTDRVVVGDGECWRLMPFDEE